MCCCVLLFCLFVWIPSQNLLPGSQYCHLGSSFLDSVFFFWVGIENTHLIGSGQQRLEVLYIFSAQPWRNRKHVLPYLRIFVFPHGLPLGDCLNMRSMLTLDFDSSSMTGKYAIALQLQWARSSYQGYFPFSRTPG